VKHMTKKKKEEKSEEQYYSLRYQKKRIKIPYPRNIRLGVCVACKRSKKKGEIKVTALHHVKYEFKLSEIFKNRFLALKNTLELCFPCHQIADGFRGILTIGSSDKLYSVTSIIRVAKLMPKNQLKRLAEFCRAFLEWYDNEKKKT